MCARVCVCVCVCVQVMSARGSEAALEKLNGFEIKHCQQLRVEKYVSTGGKYILATDIFFN